MTALLGIDYGGTETKLLLSEGTAGPVLARATFPTVEVAELAAAVAAFTAGHAVHRFAITVAGTFDADSGIVRRASNMPWLDGTAPAAQISHITGVPGQAIQDGVATALAEATLGAGRDGQDVFVIALGTGIAGAHLVGGQPRAGAHGGAGEIGHIPVGGAHLCSCGQHGCLETWIGGGQLGRRWAELGGHLAPAHEVVAAAKRGDQSAVTALDHATDALAKALLQVSAIVDPGIVVVGGGVAGSPEWTVYPAFEKARDWATFHRLGQFRLAELGMWAGAHGAVLAAGGGVCNGP